MRRQGSFVENGMRGCGRRKSDTGPMTPCRLSCAELSQRVFGEASICYDVHEFTQERSMIVTIVTFNLAVPTTLGEITKVFQGTAPKYQGMPGLLRKNYWLSEDCRRAGGIYVWASRADADRIYTPEWKKFVESKYGSPPVIEYLHSPVMVDNREGTISVAA
jgi:hypothetical protein